MGLEDFPVVKKPTYEELERRIEELESEAALRKREQDELKETRERFRAFMDNNPASIYIKDENDRHIFGNPAAMARAGKKPEEFIGSTTRDLFPPKVASRLIELDRKVLEENIPRVTEEWRNTARGDVRWRRDIKFPIKPDSGKKLLGGIAFDITSEKPDGLTGKTPFSPRGGFQKGGRTILTPQPSSFDTGYRRHGSQGRDRLPPP
jgi:PAS domain S-box-containing protein